MKERAIKLRQKTVGEFLKTARENAGMTQHQLAREFGYSSAQFISNWERGIALPPMDVLPEISRLFKVPPQTMLEVLYRYQEGFLALEREKLHNIFRGRPESREL